MAWCHCHAQPLRLPDAPFAQRSLFPSIGHTSKPNPTRKASAFSSCGVVTFDNSKRVLGVVKGVIFPVDPWAPIIDSQSIASQLFAVSLFPYIGFLYFITKSKTAPKLTLFGFYFLLAFVGATSTVDGNAGCPAFCHYLRLLFEFVPFCILLMIILLTVFFHGYGGAVPAGIYAKVHYGTSLSNVDWLHGGAEFLLTLTNLFIVLGLRRTLRKLNTDNSDSSSTIAEEEKSPSMKG